MGYLAGSKIPIVVLRGATKDFEQKIDNVQSQLPKLNSFILPQGGEVAAHLHVARSVCRRCERAVVSYVRTREKAEKEELVILQYLNRLSDLLFVLARAEAEKDVKVRIL